MNEENQTPAHPAGKVITPDSPNPSQQINTPTQNPSTFNHNDSDAHSNNSSSAWGYQESNHGSAMNAHQRSALAMSERIGQEAKTPLSMKILSIIIAVNVSLSLLAIFVPTNDGQNEYTAVVIVSLIISFLYVLLAYNLFQGSRLALRVASILLVLDVVSLFTGGGFNPLRILFLIVMTILVMKSWASLK